MVDKEKVIKGLECCAFSKHGDKCEQCPYFSGCETEYGAFVELAHDALALLKAQEPVEPQEKREGDYRNLYCGACGRGIVGYVKHTTGQYAKLSNYCNKCGQEVKWK